MSGEHVSQGSSGEARGGAVWFDRAQDSRLVLEGADAKDLLHRLSTNDVNSLTPGRGAATLLLERSGRLLDRLVVVDRGADLLLLGSPGRGDAVRAWIENLTILEDARVAEMSAATTTFLVTGEGAADAVARASGAPAAEIAGLARYGCICREAGAAPGDASGAASNETTVVRVEDHGGPAYAIVAPREAAASLAARLAPARAGDESELSRLRVASGVPAWGAELDERTLPLEARLVDAISFTKGCYIGQEIVARVFHHKRVKRLLARIAIDGATPPAAGSAVFAPDTPAPIGRVTSAAPAGVRSLALVYVESGWDAPGARLAVMDAAAPGEPARSAEVLTLHPEGDPRWPS